MNLFSQNLKFLIKRFETNQEHLAFFIGKKQATISNWMNEASYPELRDLILMRKFFGVSIEAMIFIDLEKAKLISDNHVKEFQRLGKVVYRYPTKEAPVSKEYLRYEDRSSMLMEDGAGMKEVLKLLKGIDGKVEEMRANRKMKR